MPLLWFSLVFLLLRYFEVSFVGKISWWWVALSFLVCFFWFEVIEPRLGLREKKAMDEMEQARTLRIKKALERERAPR